VDEAEKDWIGKFISHLKYERRLSDLTCKHYARDLDALAAFCDEQTIDNWSGIDSEHIRSYIPPLAIGVACPLEASNGGYRQREPFFVTCCVKNT